MIVKSNKNWLVSEKKFALKACNWHDTINCVLTAAFKCVLMAKDQHVITKHLTGLNAAKNIIIFCAKKNHFTIFLKTIYGCTQSGNSQEMSPKSGFSEDV